jgi:hypothetical protein
VNNASQSAVGVSRAENCENPRNKLLEAPDAKWVDTRTESAAGRADKAVAAMAEVNRAADGGR